MNKIILAIYGIGTYILSCIASMTNLDGVSIVPASLIAVSAILCIVFIIMATIYLWKDAKILPILYIISTIISSVVSLETSAHGSFIVIAVNITKIVSFITFVLIIIILIAKGKHEMKHV